jgi:hypothetical protein
MLVEMTRPPLFMARNTNPSLISAICNPRIDGALSPTRHRNSAELPSFTDQIYDYPSGIAQLNVREGERSGFTATEPTTNPNGE